MLIHIAHCLHTQRTLKYIIFLPLHHAPLPSSLQLSSMEPRTLTPVFLHLALCLPGPTLEAPLRRMFASSMWALVGVGPLVGVEDDEDDGVRYCLLFLCLVLVLGVFREGYLLRTYGTRLRRLSHVSCYHLIAIRRQPLRVHPFRPRAPRLGGHAPEARRERVRVGRD